MKNLPRAQRKDLEPDKVYVMAGNYSDNFANFEFWFYGPIGGIRIVHDLLCDTDDGESFGIFDGEMWHINGCEFSDVEVT